MSRIEGDKYHALDGKKLLIGQISATKDDFDMIPQQLKAVGRFSGFLKEWPYNVPHEWT